MQLKKDKKSKSKSLLNKKRDAWTGLLKKGINVSDARMVELAQLREDATRRATEMQTALKHVFAINFKSALLNEARYVTFQEIPRGTAASDEGADYEKLKRVLKHETKEFAVEALVVDMSGFVNDFDRTLLAAATMMRIPMVIVCAEPELHAEIDKATGAVWRICTTEKELQQYLEHDLPAVVDTVRKVGADVAARVEKYKHINKLQHGLKRSAVAFIPLGVYAVNFLGIARLVRRMLKKTGMLNDTEAKKAATMEAAVTGIKVSLIDATGDIYQFTITATLLAGFGAEVSAAGLEAGLASLSALDFALLGSITVVTGTVSAIGAYIARPKMVEAIANLIAILQVVCLLNPKLRRKEASSPGSADATSKASTSAGAGGPPASPSIHKFTQGRKASGEMCTAVQGTDDTIAVAHDLTDLVSDTESSDDAVDLEQETQPLAVAPGEAVSEAGVQAAAEAMAGVTVSTAPVEATAAAAVPAVLVEAGALR